MEIILYLAELLQNRKQVGIPGLGTFYKTKTPGRYDEKTHSFLPPSYSLQFSTDMLEDEALAQYISSKRNISIDSANYFIEQFSDKAVQELSESNETQLGDIGKLSTIDGEIVFEQGSAIATGFEYFGLPKVKREELNMAAEAEPTAPEEEPEVETEAESAAPEEEEKPDAEEEAEVEEAETEVEEKSEAEAEEVAETDEPHPVRDQILIEQVEDDVIDEDDAGEDKTSETESPAPAEHKTDYNFHIEQLEDDYIDEPEKEPLPDPEAEKMIEEAEEKIEEIEEKIEETEEKIEEAEAEEKEEEQKAEEIIQENTLEEENPGDTPKEAPTFFPKEINAYRAEPSDQYEDRIRENKKPLMLKIILICLLLIALLVAAYFLYPKLINPNTEVVEQSVPLDSMEYANDPYTADSLYLDSLDQAAAMAIDTVSTDTLVAPAPVPAPVKSVVKPDTVTTYEIIIGALANRKEADKFLIQMKNKGIKAKIVDTSARKWLKISIASFTDREKAAAEQRRLAKELKNPEIYIYTNKPKK